MRWQADGACQLMVAAEAYCVAVSNFLSYIAAANLNGLIKVPRRPRSQ